jgi:hypothetical protein
MENVDGLALPAGVRVGDYVIESEDGEGYVAAHVLLPRQVRLSIMPPTAEDHRPVAVRMMREACILEALRHPGVPRVYEVGVVTHAAGDSVLQRPWIASELVDGEVLADALAEGEYVSVVELLGIVRDVADILAYAHARNVAHRGVRPEAIIRGDGTRGFPVCLVNWAMAHVPEEEGAHSFADDIFALGLVADVILGTRRAIMSKVAALIDAMLAPNPRSRPSAVDVGARAAALLAALNKPVPEAIDEVLEERMMFAETSRVTPPPMPVRKELHWTPTHGIAPLPTGALASGGS